MHAGLSRDRETEGKRVRGRAGGAQDKEQTPSATATALFQTLDCCRSFPIRFSGLFLTQPFHISPLALLPPQASDFRGPNSLYVSRFFHLLLVACSQCCSRDQGLLGRRRGRFQVLIIDGPDRSVELEKQSYCDLKVANNTEHHVAFKVKTTSPKKYFVRPNTGIIQPWDSCVVTVTLQAQKEYPPDMQCRDKFLLQSTKVPPAMDTDEIPSDAFNKDADKVIEECKLRVVYTMPGSGQGSESESGLSSSVSRSSKHGSEMDGSSSTEDVSNNSLSPPSSPFPFACDQYLAFFYLALQRLKEERDSARRQTQQLQQELEMLKRRRSRRNDEGFSLTFAAFVGLIGIMFGFLLNLTLSAPPPPAE
ncbi:hypothetical protein ACLOJK_033854 [Asimina triloba]